MKFGFGSKGTPASPSVPPHKVERHYVSPWDSLVATVGATFLASLAGTVLANLGREEIPLPGGPEPTPVDRKGSPSQGPHWVGMNPGAAVSGNPSSLTEAIQFYGAQVVVPRDPKEKTTPLSIKVPYPYGPRFDADDRGSTPDFHDRSRFEDELRAAFQSFFKEVRSSLSAPVGLKDKPGALTEVQSVLGQPTAVYRDFNGTAIASFEGPASLGKLSVRVGLIDPENLRLAEKRLANARRIFDEEAQRAGVDTSLLNVTFGVDEPQPTKDQIRELDDLAKRLGITGRDIEERRFKLTQMWNNGEISIEGLSDKDSTLMESVYWRGFTLEGTVKTSIPQGMVITFTPLPVPFLRLKMKEEDPAVDVDLLSNIDRVPGVPYREIFNSGARVYAGEGREKAHKYLKEQFLHNWSVKDGVDHWANPDQQDWAERHADKAIQIIEHRFRRFPGLKGQLKSIHDSPASESDKVSETRGFLERRSEDWIDSIVACSSKEAKKAVNAEFGRRIPLSKEEERGITTILCDERGKIKEEYLDICEGFESRKGLLGNTLSNAIKTELAIIALWSRLAGRDLSEDRDVRVRAARIVKFLEKYPLD